MLELFIVNKIIDEKYLKDFWDRSSDNIKDKLIGKKFFIYPLKQIVLYNDNYNNRFNNPIIKYTNVANLYFKLKDKNKEEIELLIKSIKSSKQIIECLNHKSSVIRYLALNNNRLSYAELKRLSWLQNDKSNKVVKEYNNLLLITLYSYLFFSIFFTIKIFI
jgi:hypothetical protein